MTSATDRSLILALNPASLMKTSAVTVAAELWRVEMSKNNFDSRSLKNAHPRIDSIISVPASIKAMIDVCIIPMKKSMISWLDFHYLRAFYPYDKTTGIAAYIDCLTWMSNCQMSYQETAKNLLRSPRLSHISKYKLACLYCFEEDIRRLWETLPCDDGLRNISFGNDPMLYYWACRLKNEPLSIETRGNRSIDGEMMERSGTWSSFMFFWNRLSSTEQIDLFVHFVKKNMENETKYLMSHLSETQLETAIERSSVKIVVALAVLPENSEYALQIWNYMKNTVTVDAYVDMIIEIAILEIPHVSNLLHLIWTQTPDRLKNQVLADHEDIVLNNLFSIDTDIVAGLPRDIKFLTELLRRKDLRFRNNYWMENWLWLIIGLNSARLSALMKLCFENDEEIAHFKSAHLSNYPEIKTYCVQLLSEGCFDELNEFLNFCSSDPTVVSKLKKDIVWSKASIKYCVRYYGNEQKVGVFEEFAKDVQVEQDCGMGLKYQLISSFWNDGYLRGLMNGGNMLSIKNLVCSVSNDDSDTSNMKNKLLETSQCILVKAKFRTFDPEEWNEFLRWCMNDDEDQLVKFKESLPVDDIFLKLFDQWVNSVETSLWDYSGNSNDSTGRRFIFDNDSDSDSNNGSDLDAASDNRHNDTELESHQSEDDHESMNDGSVQDSNQSEFEIEANGTDSFYDEDSYTSEISMNESELTDNILESFDNLDNFLKWYFSNDEKIHEFKIMQIQHQGDDMAVNPIFAYEDERLEKIALEWFFSGDVEKMEIFMAALK